MSDDDAIVILAALHRLVRDNEDACKITFECDASQLQRINRIPTQTLLKLKISVDEGGKG